MAQGLSNGAFTRTNGAQSDNASVYPQFFMDSVEDIVASEQQGRPIFRDEERVKIIMAGNPWSAPVFRVAEEHRQRWPKEYDAFKKGQEIAPDGTPLEQWPVLKKAMVLELKAIGFMTVEQVAAMSDQAIQRIGMGGRRLKDLALAYLDEAQAAAIVTAARADSERKDSEIAALRLQVENMSSQLQQMHTHLMEKLDAPSQIATMIPGVSDPAELARQGRPPAIPAQSSLAGLPDAPAPRRKRAQAAQGDLVGGGT